MRRVGRASVAYITLSGLLVACSGGSATPSAAPQRIATASHGSAAVPLSVQARTTSTATPTATHPCGFRTTRPTTYRHVIWIWLENHSYGQVVGHMPYLDSVARACGLATNFHSLTHPSLPNYIAATSGGFHGIHTDCEPRSCMVRARSLFGQLQQRGMTWKGYAESMPVACDRVTSGSYAARHNPPVYYTDVRRCSRRDVPLTSRLHGLRHDLDSGRLPAYASVTPNICHDMHDCSVATGDAWLSTWLPRIFKSTAWAAGRTAVFVTFDEGAGSGSCSAYPAGCHVATWVMGPAVHRGTRSATRFTTYSLLETTERMLGIHHLLGHAGDPGTRSMRRAFGL